MTRPLLAALLYGLFTLLFTWQVVNTVRDWTVENLHKQGSDQLLQVIIQLRSLLDEYRYLPFLISQSRDVKELMLRNDPDLSTEVSLFLEQTNLVAGTSSLFVLSSHGIPLAYSHWRDEQNFFQRSHISQQYFKQGEAGHRGRQFSLNSETQSPAYFLSSPVYDGKTFSGVAVVRIELETLVNKLRSFGTVLLSDENGTVFLTTGPFQRFKTVSDQARISSTQLSDGADANIWHRGVNHWLARSVELDDLRWNVTVLNDFEVVDKNMQTASLFSFGGCFAFGLFILFYRERKLKLRSQDETREALARSEAQQKAIINNAQVGIFLIDSKGIINFANETALQQFTLSMALINGKPLLQLIAMGPDSPVNRVIGRLNQTGFSPLIGYESVGIRGDETSFPIMISIRKMAFHGDQLFLVTVIDISRRKALEVQLQRANETLEHKVEERTKALQEAQNELVQAGKMAAVGRMSTAVVHELNQPLTAIRNYVAICRQMLSEPEMMAESLEQVDDLTQRMAQITSQLKNFAYRKPEQLEKVSVQMSIQHALQLFKQRIPEQGVEVELSLPDDTVYVLGDSARLEQVLVNLIKNALDAMQNQADAKLSIRLEVGEKIEIRVTDSGPGIEPDMLPTLFEPFVTTKSIGEGLGLGLAIVKSIVLDLQGEIRATNQKEGGAEFVLHFPVVK